VFTRRKRELVAPAQDAVVDRVLCISAVAMLGAIAAALEDGTMEAGPAAEYLTESHRWLIRENLAHALSGSERKLLAKPLADWTGDELIGANWRSESMGVLLWALSALDDMPPYDARFERLPSFVPLLAPTIGFRKETDLRPAEEIARARAVAELWHWRARTRQLQERGETPAGGRDLDAIAREAATLAHADGSIPPPVEGDFPAYGKAFGALDPEEYSDVSAGAAERHYALNWLCGSAGDWDSVPTDT
jgi:Domain of unknown function (DUF4272)